MTRLTMSKVREKESLLLKFVMKIKKTKKLRINKRSLTSLTEERVHKVYIQI